VESGQGRMKNNGRLGIERHLELAHDFITVQVGIYAALRHCFLSVSKLKADDLLSGAHHIFGDAHWLRR